MCLVTAPWKSAKSGGWAGRVSWGVLHAFVDLHHLVQGGRLVQTGYGAQDVLQLFALDVEEVAQAQLLGSDGGDDLIEAALSGQRGIILGECGH